MNRISFFIAIILIALGIAAQTPSYAQQGAQQKQPQRPRHKKPAPAAKAKPTPTPDMRAEASRVAEQIKKVSSFIYVYGKVVNGLQIADEEAKSNQASPEAKAINKQNRNKLMSSLGDLRAGVENLATEFQANPRLQIQYLKVAYAATAADDAERLASEGRYEEAGRSLITVVERLADALISMRLP